MIRQVVYVMSLNFSGSTILSFALSLLRGGYFVGEPALIFRRSGSGYKHSKFCTPCKAREASHECPIWGDEVIEALRLNPGSYWSTLAAGLPEDRSLIIDASKDLGWIRNQLPSSIEPCIIHISKSPHAWIASLKRKNQIQFPLEFYALLWADSLEKIRKFSTDHGIKYLYLEYESLVGDFAGTMGKIARHLGREWRSGRVVNLTDFHYVKGNPGVNKRVEGESAIDLSKDLVLDTSWKQVLSDSDMDRIYGIRRIRDLARQYNRYPSDMFTGAPSGSTLSIAYSKLLYRAYQLFKGHRS